jgi:hypothetical protein
MVRNSSDFSVDAQKWRQIFELPQACHPGKPLEVVRVADVPSIPSSVNGLRHGQDVYISFDSVIELRHDRTK